MLINFLGGPRFPLAPSFGKAMFGEPRFPPSPLLWESNVWGTKVPPIPPPYTLLHRPVILFRTFPSGQSFFGLVLEVSPFFATTF